MKTFLFSDLALLMPPMAITMTAEFIDLDLELFELFNLSDIEILDQKLRITVWDYDGRVCRQFSSRQHDAFLLCVVARSSNSQWSQRWLLKKCTIAILRHSHRESKTVLMIRYAELCNVPLIQNTQIEINAPSSNGLG